MSDNILPFPANRRMQRAMQAAARVGQRDFAAVASRVLQDAEPVGVTLNIASTWMLICSLQLTCKHPELPPQSREFYIDMANMLAQAIVERHPEAALMIEAGWRADE